LRPHWLTVGKSTFAAIAAAIFPSPPPDLFELKAKR